MDKTINGKTLGQIFAELTQPFDKNKIRTRDYDKMPYISVDDLRERLDSVVGSYHYNETYTEPKIMKVKDTYGVSVIGRIEFLDDNFEPVLVKECVGGTSITFPKVDKQISNALGNVETIKQEMTTTNSFANDCMAACQDAFKRICKKIGIGAKDLEQAAKGEVYEVTLKFPVDYSRSTKGYFSDITSGGAPVRLAVFSNKLELFKAGIPQGTAAGTSFYIVGKLGKDNRGNDQIIFADFATQ